MDFIGNHWFTRIYSKENLSLLPFSLHSNCLTNISISGWPWPAKLASKCPEGILKLLCTIKHIKFETTKAKIEDFYRESVKEIIEWKVPLNDQSELVAAKIEFVFEMIVPSKIWWIEEDLAKVLKRDTSFYLKASSWIRKEALTRAVILVGTEIFPWIEEEYTIFKVSNNKKIGNRLSEITDPLSPTVKPKTTLLTFDMDQKKGLLNKIISSIGTADQVTQSANSVRIMTKQIPTELSFEELWTPTDTEDDKYLVTFEESADTRSPMFINSLLPIQSWSSLLEILPQVGTPGFRTAKERLKNFSIACKFLLSNSLISSKSWISLILGVGYNYILLICHEFITESPYVIIAKIVKISCLLQSLLDNDFLPVRFDKEPYQHTSWSSDLLFFAIKLLKIDRIGRTMRPDSRGLHIPQCTLTFFFRLHEE
jgi:hypothetical protein